jgi:Ca-activated chloride channel homolog
MILLSVRIPRGRVPSGTDFVRLARIAAVALSLAALAAALLPTARGPVHLLVLLDDSASVPRPWVDQAWAELVPVIARLPRDSRLSVVRLGSRPVIEVRGHRLDDGLPTPYAAQPPRRLPLSDSGTAIAAGLSTALRLQGGGESGLILLISDGQENLGQANPLLHRLATAGIPVRWWDPGADRILPDAAVSALTVAVGTDGRAVAAIGLAADTAVDAQVLATLDDRTILNRRLALDGTHPVDLDLGLEVLAPGTHLLTARIEAPGDLRPGNDRRGAVLRVPGPPRVGVLANGAGPSSIAGALTGGGWGVEVLDTAVFDVDRLSAFGVLILDGIRPADLNAAAWTAIERAVTRDGTGLILLGGPGTFGAGGYRHSVLEGLLPVSAQAPDRTPAAAVIFAVDTSGSMAQPTRFESSRLELAQAAVAAATRVLEPRDQAALIGFDVEARVLLPLAPQTEGAAATAAWHPSPGGGTRLKPAIERALDLFGPDTPGQRLLVLLSDGQITDPQETGELGRRLAQARVQLSIIAVGKESAGAPLQALAETAGGRYQVVTDLPALPQLTQAEIERRNDPVEPGPLTPRVTAPLPIAAPPEPPWPQILAYPVTRPRDAAQVYLTAPNGDPLLAAWHAGSGRVIVLPAGLGTWTPAWPAWSHWGDLVGGLVDWAAGGSEPGEASLDLQSDGTARLRIEVAGSAGHWSAGEPIELLIQGPEGFAARVQAEPVAPGRYETRLPDAPTGRYRILAAGDGTFSTDLWYQPDLEFTPDPGGGLQAAAAAGLLARWSPRDGELPLPRVAGRLPRLLVLAALLSFLSALLLERLPLARSLDPRAPGSGNGQRSTH